jgi:hypothetical protein
MDTPTCDVCGAPATHGARDMYCHEPPGALWVSYSPKGATKYGCQLHPVESIETWTDCPPPESWGRR